MDGNKQTKKEWLINEIIFACKVNDVPDLDTVWINLVAASEDAVVKIAKELYINTD